MDNTTVEKLNEIKSSAENWLESYEAGNFAQAPSQQDLQAEATRMQEILEKVKKVLDNKEQLLERAAQEENTAWEEAYNALKAQVEENPFFANCFGNATDPLQEGEEVTKEMQKFAADIKAEASEWYGLYFDGDAAPQEVKATVAAIHDRAKEILSAQKNSDQDLVIRFIGGTTGDSRKVSQLLDKLVEDVAGSINIEKFEDKGDGAIRKKYNIEHLPTLIFKRNGQEFARHEGDISTSELQSKLNTMLDGGSFSDSSNVISLDGQRTITDRELFSLGEFVVIYFDAVWSGVSKKVGDTVKDEVLALGAKSNKTTTIKYQGVTIDGRTHIHKKFHVDKVPTIIYLRDGNEVGRHEGYINPSQLKEDMRRFLANGSVGNSSTNEVDLLGIEYSQNEANSKQVNDNIPKKLSGNVGKGGKNNEMDVYAIQVLLAQNGFRLKADGVANSDLEKAIYEFQTAFGLEAAGTVEPGDDTWDALS